LPKVLKKEIIPFDTCMSLNFLGIKTLRFIFHTASSIA